MIRRRPPVSRRRLLQGIGAGCIGLPWLRSTPSAASGSGFPLRLLIMFTPNEWIDRSHWDLGHAPGEQGPLPANLPGYLSALDPFVDKLNLVGDLALQSRAHEDHAGGHVGTGHILTGVPVIPFNGANSGEPEFYAGGISVDQFIAQRLGVDALTLAVTPGAKNGHGRISYSAANTPVDPITAPLAAFDHVFGDFDQPPAIVDALREQRRSVLDVVNGNLDRVHATMPSEDRVKLQAHMDGIRTLEQQLDQPLMLSCDGTPAAPNVPAGYGDGGIGNAPQTHRHHMDVAVQALACGTTEVASIQFGGAASQYITPNWGNDPVNPLAIPRDLHNISHDYNNPPTGTTPAELATLLSRRIAKEEFFAGQFAYLLQQMDAVPEGDETLLDHSIVLWCKELGHHHAPDELLFVMAGGACGQLETGRFLSFADQPHNDLLVSLCNLMGLDDVTSFGLPIVSGNALDL